MLWKRGYSTPCSKDLDFTWATFEWKHDHSIYHNAGIVEENIDDNGFVHPFYKAYYMNRSPILAPKPDKKWVSSWYYNLIRRAWEQTADVDKSITGLTVLTLTWERKELLEEAIHSFILQDDPKAEMLIINDDPEVTYQIDKEYEDKGVKIINVRQKFKTFMDKLRFGFEQSRWDYVYRLDDDDLLDEWALYKVRKEIDQNPGFDIYRASNHWFVHMADPKQTGVSGGVNNGNTFRKHFALNMDWANAPEPPGEDQWYFNRQMARHYEWAGATMLYRWASAHYHLTNKPIASSIHENQEQYHKKEKGTGIQKLNPHWREDWFKHRIGQLKPIK
jgi:glycosyltransferase involved in cell wall biosynthesis